MRSDQLHHLQRLLLRIPPGKVTTYKALAQAMDLKGYRYVGQLLGSNPDPQRYPCYKVVRSDGSLGGFALGCEEKEKRLKVEGIEVVDGKIKNFEQKIYTFKTI